ncbi:SETMR methyltransferase, partial [Acromyrmex charruanus]
MEKNEFRAVIKHLHMKGLTPKKIKAELDNAHSTSAPAFATVYNWVNEFKRGRTSTCTSFVTSKRVTISKQCLEMFQRNLDEFLRRFITVDETWIHYFTPETKEQSKQWISPREPAPKKAKTVKSVGKVMKKVLFHPNNARVYTCPAPMAKFNEFRYELLLHPAYSPDLAPCNYFLFPNLKKLQKNSLNLQSDTEFLHHLYISILNNLH